MAEMAEGDDGDMNGDGIVVDDGVVIEEYTVEYDDEEES